jgi:DNA-binding NarL/FixJ family response regulator
MSGSTAFAALREINPEARVLLASGYAKDSNVAGLLERGAAGFLNKPYLPEDLAKQVNTLLRLN